MDTDHVLRKLAGFSLLIVVALAGCDDDDDREYAVRLETSADVVEGGVARVALWGFNATVADNPATKIVTDTVPVAEFPAEINATWPDDAHTLIQTPPVNDESVPDIICLSLSTWTMTA